MADGFREYSQKCYLGLRSRELYYHNRIQQEHFPSKKWKKWYIIIFLSTPSRHVAASSIWYTLNLNVCTENNDMNKGTETPWLLGYL